jgi:N-acetylglucosaminyl-diphospho-decaprenol L-rhamnosyltransferase
MRGEMTPASTTETQARPPHSRPALDVIIVSANGGRELLRTCLLSLQANAPELASMRVHVVDNGSKDGTVEMVQEDFREVEIDAIGRNTGFSVANNRAISRTNGEFVLLLNPDTEARPGALDRCIEVIAQRSEVGVLGCRLVRLDGTFDHAAKRSFPTMAGAVGHFLGVGRKMNRGPLAQYRAPELGEEESGPVDAVNGAFMLARRAAIDDVGLLDEAYWMYAEDLDWCFRFHQQGWTVWYEGSATMVHVKGALSKTGRHRPLRANYAFHHAMARFYRKHLSGDRPLMDAVIYTAIGAKFVISAARSSIMRRAFR